MTNTDIFSKSFIQQIKSTHGANIIQPVKIGETTKENEYFSSNLSFWMLKMMKKSLTASS